MAIVIALVAGLLFGAGLIVSGMANPAKVLGFLDLFGQWDPSLAFVMAGAIAVGVIAFFVARRRADPIAVGNRRDRAARARQRRVRHRLGAGRFLPGAGIGGAGRGRAKGCRFCRRHAGGHGCLQLAATQALGGRQCRKQTDNPPTEDNMTLRKLIDESGVARMTLYRHFAGKEDLIKEVLEQR